MEVVSGLHGPGCREQGLRAEGGVRGVTCRAAERTERFLLTVGDALLVGSVLNPHRVESLRLCHRPSWRRDGRRKELSPQTGQYRELATKIHQVDP